MPNSLRKTNLTYTSSTKKLGAKNSNEKAVRKIVGEIDPGSLKINHIVKFIDEILNRQNTKQFYSRNFTSIETENRKISFFKNNFKKLKKLVLVQESLCWFLVKCN